VGITGRAAMDGPEKLSQKNLERARRGWDEKG
jgi:hypothetical protein